jgi:ubiquinone/menaquinone biosynthesis C-methylase UbiE
MKRTDEEAAARFAEDARERFEALYERMPSWEIPHPQPAFIELFERGLIGGTVLDAGCGTGENALWLAARGMEVFGVDLAHSAIGWARSKAQARGVPAARFLVGDALRLDELGMSFRTVIDSGLFHSFTDPERALYVQSLAGVLEPQGQLHVLCWSDEQDGVDGPRRVSQAEIRSAFVTGWTVLEIVPARFVNNTHPGGAKAWRASLARG